MTKKRTSITISKEALKKADKKSKEEGRNRSNWIERLILKTK